MSLSVFSDGDYEWYVAESLEEARKMQLAMYGENTGEAEEWFECEPSAMMKIWWHNAAASSPDEPGAVMLTKTFNDWAAINGPGFLCGTEF